jgi:hypothetical protein
MPNKFLFLFFLSVMFSCKNNNNLQFNIILNFQAIVLQSFIQISGMACTYFSIKLAISKSN